MPSKIMNFNSVIKTMFIIEKRCIQVNKKDPDKKKKEKKRDPLISLSGMLKLKELSTMIQLKQDVLSETGRPLLPSAG